MNDTLEITTLGGLEIRIGGEPVTGFYSRKVEALLVYVACTGRPQPRDVLADLLWDEVTQSRAMGSLRVALHHLREKLGPYVEITRTTVELNTNSAVWLDVVELENKLGNAAETAGLTSPADADQVADAVSLYQGDFLAGFYVRDCPRFEEWQLVEQERLRNLVVGALGALVNREMDQQAYDSALEHAQRLVKLDPLLEEGYRQIMMALACSGQRRAALAQYDAARQMLQAELGVEPEEETTALYERIGAGDIGAPAMAGVRPKHNLPRPVTPFVGRAPELAEITALLEDPACQLLTLVGPGGSGKTRLALETAKRQLGRYPDGVYFVSLAPLTNTAGIVPTVAEAVGFTFYAAGQGARQLEARQQLLNYLSGKRVLLVMDNYEHLLSSPQGHSENKGAGTALVSDILRTAPGVKILATSRSRLNVGGEYRFQVGGMQLPDSETLEQRPETLGHYSAVELFLQGARRARPELVPTGDDLHDIVRICRLVDGLPLGIRLAAGWLEMLTPAEIADQVASNLDFLETGRQDVPARQRSMRAVFDHSWKLLNERERTVIEALSVFRGGFTTEAAQAVSGASLRDLMTLVNRSLIHRTPGERYEIHELLRQYAAQELEASADGADAVRDRHSAYYCRALDGWGADLWCERQETAMAALRVDRENARAAWDWAVERGHVEQLDKAVFGLSYFYVWRARHDEGNSACRSAAEKLATLIAEIETVARGSCASGCTSSEPRRLTEALRVWAKVLACHACVADVMGAKEEALRLARQSLALLERPELTGVDTRWEQAYAWLQAGDASKGIADLNERRLMYERSLVLYQELGERWGMAKALGALGWVNHSLGAIEEGPRALEESLAIQRELGDRRRMALSLNSSGWLAAELGRFEEAERLAGESVTLSTAIGDRLYLVLASRGLGAALIGQGRFGEARSVLGDSVAILEDTDPLYLSAQSLQFMAFALLHLGDYSEARALARTTPGNTQDAELRRAAAMGLWLQGAVALAENAIVEAERWLRESVAAFRESGDREPWTRIFACLVHMTSCLRRHRNAWRQLYEVIVFAIERSAFYPLVYALPVVALLLADEDQAERAVELYALASRYPHVGNSKWFEDVAGKEMAAVAAALPCDVAAAARERGKMRDLWETAAELLEELEGVSGEDWRSCF